MSIDEFVLGWSRCLWTSCLDAVLEVADGDVWVDVEVEEWYGGMSEDYSKPNLVWKVGACGVWWRRLGWRSCCWWSWGGSSWVCRSRLV